jgi:methylmalonyl-CoA mutase cobalamin-binding subunit
MNLPMQQSQPGLSPADFCLAMHAAPSGAAARRQREALVRTIEDQIVPRLLVARASQELCAAAVALTESPPSRAVLDLVALALGPDEHAVRDFVVAAAATMTLQSLCLGLLQPAARHLGDLWTDDLADFTDVTIGMIRLHHGLNAVTGLAGESTHDAGRRHRIMLAPAPGDDHRFGLAMVGAFFRQAGWAVTAAQEESLSDIASLLRREWFGVLGFSVSAEIHVAALAAALPRLRAASRNTGLSVLVGGPIFATRPELVHEIGADATAVDGVQATWVAENMLAGRPPYS